MKKLFAILFVLVFLGALGGSGYLLYRRAHKPPVIYRVETPVRTTILKKAVATGAVVPRQEVAIKPQVSGILDQLEVEPGTLVRSGDLVARVRVVPNMVSLNAAQSRVERAKIALDQATADHTRYQALREEGTVSQAQYQQFEIALRNATEELAAARDNLDIVERGTTGRLASAANTLVRATVSGMILEVPVEIGRSVIEANTFNDGTTIATVADMDDMIFKGRVDESEVGKIRPGMHLLVRIGAIEAAVFDATLEHIAPKGVEESGAIQFEIRAAVAPRPDLFLRANYSANADIVLDRRDDVLAIDESLLQFADGEPFVEVEVGEQRFERRPVRLGLSDGIRVEILSGLDEGTRIKQPNTDLTAVNGAGGGGRRAG
ncbi:MAG TPA: efflux RND transporter periplasmic adaptor subunit [Thermoanaerobaculia bacterium]|nr:efflux RND transporter periplasmic adaptor subunit [Thermoanaerobaculia bacterium]